MSYCDNPEGPFEKYENNPIMFSGHEVSLFPFKEGVAAIVIKDGNEHYTIQYAEDWKNFEIASITALLPNAPAGFIPDAFDDNGNGRGITWGLCHFIAQGDNRNYTRLDRFDCDLSLDFDEPSVKGETEYFDRDVYMSRAPTDRHKKQILEMNKMIKNTQN